MTWCDKLASTPTVGFKLSTHFAPIDILLNSWAPILDRASEKESKDTSIDHPSKPFATGFRDYPAMS